MNQTIIAHGHCARVIDTPSQGVSYLRIEVPVELHAQLTTHFYGRPVLVMLAGPEFAGQPFGLHLQTLPAGQEAQEGQEQPPAATTPATGRQNGPGAPIPGPARPAQGRAQGQGQGKPGALCLSAVQLCQEPAFRQFVASQREDGQPPGSAATADEAAAFVREWCGVESRRDLDTAPGASAAFRDLMAEYRDFIAAGSEA